jgi:hypothetical protein
MFLALNRSPLPAHSRARRGSPRRSPGSLNSISGILTSVSPPPHPSLHLRVLRMLQGRGRSSLECSVECCLPLSGGYCRDSKSPYNAF